MCRLSPRIAKQNRPTTRSIWRSLNILLTHPVSSANITPLTDSECGVPHAVNSYGGPCALRRGSVQNGDSACLTGSRAAAHTSRSVDSRRRLVLNRLPQSSRFGHCYIPSERLRRVGVHKRMHKRKWHTGALYHDETECSLAHSSGVLPVVSKTLCDTCNGRNTTITASLADTSALHRYARIDQLRLEAKPQN
jgi:hypothetical protein